MSQNSESICQVVDCGRVHYALGYCNGHWQQYRVGGPEKVGPLRRYGGDRTCRFPDCGRPLSSSEYCQSHRLQKNKGQELKPIGDRIPQKGLTCTVPNCSNPSRIKGYCKGHQKIRYFNLSVSQVENLFTDPHCAICGKAAPLAESSERNLHIDHDHSCCNYGNGACGKCVRGLLCMSCNHGLGFYNDNVDLLQNAINYLKQGYAK